LKEGLPEGYSVERLPRLMNSCTEPDIAMAYVKISGLRILLKNADAFLKRGASLRIVFGDSSKQKERMRK